MAVLFPIGYGTRLGTIEEVMAYSKSHLMDPGYLRRLKAWLLSRKGHIGVGGAFRITQPDKPGFAPDGRSFHQLQRFVDGGDAFMAVDLVARNGTSVHRAPRWDEVPAQGSSHPDIWTYGVHCNVNGEPWHMQAIEVDGWLSWINNGRKRPNPNFILPGTTPTPPPPVEPIVFDPINTAQFGLWPLNKNKAPLTLGSSGDAVLYLKGVIHHHGQRFARWFVATGQADSADRANWLHYFGDPAEACTVDGSHNRYDERLFHTVYAMKMAFNYSAYDGQQIGALDVDSELSGDTDANTWKFIDAISDGQWY